MQDGTKRGQRQDHHQEEMTDCMGHRTRANNCCSLRKVCFLCGIVSSAQLLIFTELLEVIRGTCAPVKIGLRELRSP